MGDEAAHCIQFLCTVCVVLFFPGQALLQLNPYHIDSLLQLSDVCRIQEDQEMARDLIGEDHWMLCVMKYIVFFFLNDDSWGSTLFNHNLLRANDASSLKAN